MPEKGPSHDGAADSFDRLCQSTELTPAQAEYRALTLKQTREDLTAEELRRSNELSTAQRPEIGPPLTKDELAEFKDLTARQIAAVKDEDWTQTDVKRARELIQRFEASKHN